MNAIHPEPLVQVLRREAALRLVLNRPHARNALSEPLMAALQAALEDAANDAQTRIVILAANGPVFCSGHDLKEMMAHRQDADRGRVAYAALFAQCSKLI